MTGETTPTLRELAFEATRKTVTENLAPETVEVVTVIINGVEVVVSASNLAKATKEAAQKGDDLMVLMVSGGEGQRGPSKSQDGNPKNESAGESGGLGNRSAEGSNESEGHTDSDSARKSTQN